MLNSTVQTISHSRFGVEVTLADGSSLNADYAIVTFSLGVLQNDDVEFSPQLPAWKLEGIHSMKMVSYLRATYSSHPPHLNSGDFYEDFHAVSGEVLVRHSSRSLSSYERLIADK